MINGVPFGISPRWRAAPGLGLTIRFLSVEGDLMKYAMRRGLACVGVVFLVAVVVLTGGCDSAGDQQGVTGVVTLDGEPLADASIEFVPTGDAGSTSFGKTDSGGKFVMEFSGSASGVIPGEYQVRISTHDVADPDNNIEAKPELVAKKYRGEDSELTATVVLGEKNHFEFNLEADDENIVQPTDDADDT
jgi:hypothetical protein